MDKRLKKICIIGHFGSGKVLLNGQTVKTRIISDGLDKKYGEENVNKKDTHGGKIKLFFTPFMVWRALKHSENVIILPAHNGLRVIAPLLVSFNRFFHRRLHYCVIGGWLPTFLGKRKRLAKKLKKLDYIYVETSGMKNAMGKLGFTNTVVMPNCKDLNILKPEELVTSEKEPYKLCTFSRVMKEKGIEDAVFAVKRVNEEAKRKVYTLDIYGQVEEGQKEWFKELEKSFPDYVKYCGLVPYDKSTEVLKDYFALLFPTRFYTEGIPGTIIDAYAAGIPVISSKWENFVDIIDENVGFGYEFENVKELLNILTDLSIQRDKINSLKSNCLNEAKKYTTENVIGVLKI